jgi:hypothetical protein
MPILILLGILIAPRIALVLTWLLSDRISAVYDGILIPLIGFFLLPATTLAYAFAADAGGGVSGFGYVVVGIGLLVDLLPIFRGRRK